MKNRMSNSSEVAASKAYAIEAFKAPVLKRWGSTLLSVVIAVVTLGGTASPVIGRGYRIIDRRSGDVVQQVSDTLAGGGNAGAVLAEDLRTLSSAEFAERWL